MRGLLIGLAIVAGLLALFLLAAPDQAAALDTSGWARLSYLLLILLLVGGGMFGLRGRYAEQPTGKGPGMLMSALIWAALFVLIVVLYRGAWFWTGVTDAVGGAFN